MTLRKSPESRRHATTQENGVVFQVILAVLLGMALFLFLMYLVQKRREQEEESNTNHRPLAPPEKMTIAPENRITFEFDTESQTQRITLKPPSVPRPHDILFKVTVSPLDVTTDATDVTLQPSPEWTEGKYILLLGLPSLSPPSMSTLALHTYSKKTLAALKKSLSSGVTSQMITVNVGKTDPQTNSQTVSVQGYGFGNYRTLKEVNLRLETSVDASSQTITLSPAVNNSKDSTRTLLPGFIFPNQDVLVTPPPNHTDYLSLMFTPDLILPRDAV